MELDNNAVPQRKRTVLIVEDVEMNREILCALLEDEYHTLEAENGLEGLEQLAEHMDELSLILLDVYMPECDGFEFLERKRADGRFDLIPVIMMTSSSEVADEIRCLELGATDFVTKPYNAEVLKNRMRSVIRLRESAAMLGHLEYDALTGLYSREFFYINVRELLHDKPDARYDLVIGDVEHFRVMNERWGRVKCDNFLRSLAKRLSDTLPGCVMGGRVGADVLAFLLEHREATDWATLLDYADPDPFFSRFVVKYGVYEDVDRDLTVASMCDRATLALSRVKKRFHRNVALFDETMRRKQVLEHQIEENMEASLANREFQIYYQPKHDLRADRTGGAEALVRWRHPQLGFIHPDDFVPLFERNGFVTQLDFYIWEEVCRELRRCLQQGLPMVPVSVNVSRLDFEIPDLAARIAALADRYGLDHSLLHIELTESMYTDDPERIVRALSELHENGFVIELDDFGSGYSSLTSLSTLALDVMKLDMSMIRHATATNDYSILRFAVLLADGMRLKTVVEGVETAEQVAALKVLGCDYIQGYYFSKPLPADLFEEYLKTHDKQEERS